MAKIATFYDHIVDISRQENMFVVDALKLARELGGTGLGLSIVKHGAVCLGAQLRVESDLGVGTTITVQFHKAGKEQSP